jgi:peptidoglycan/xylan/chitin deacetylase (PgdA/CDA1 family)
LLKKIYSEAIWRKRETEKILYLTFDDGPIPEVTPWVLDLLNEHNIKATFFCVGDNLVKHPILHKRILKENHVIGNHTHNHLSGWSTLSKIYFENIELCENTLKQPEGKKLFRPPYGKIKKSQLKALSKEYSVVMWDVLSGDYDKYTSQGKCFQNVTSNVRNGSIIVFHDSIKAETNLKYALPRVIKFAKENGYSFDSL